jgi:invasin-like protein/Big-like domain-containing protein
MSYRVVVALLLGLSLLPAIGCDKATPVAPNGTILTISANPSKIGLTGRSTITVVGRKPDGNALNPGTEVRLSVDKGTLDSSILSVDSRGEATTTFHGDGRPGAAKITAMTGGGMTMATTEVQVGETDTTKPKLIVTANPSVIPVEGSSTITVIARNSDGSPASGQRIILTSNLGSLSNDNPRTGSDGTATAILTAGKQSGTATVSAVLGASDPATAMVEIRGRNLLLQANPASIQRPASGDAREIEIVLTATVTDFEGNAVKGVTVTFQPERGTLRPGGNVPTNDTGVATTSLFVTRNDLEGASTFRVTASIPSGSSEPVTQTVTISVSGT